MSLLTMAMSIKEKGYEKCSPLSLFEKMATRDMEEYNDHRTVSAMAFIPTSKYRVKVAVVMKACLKYGNGE